MNQSGAGGTGGVGGGPSPTPETSPLGGLEGIPSGNVEAALHTGVRTLGELKNVLVQNLGQKEGMKVYNQFMTSFATIMLQQLQDSASQAQQATQNMRQDVS